MNVFMNFSLGEHFERYKNDPSNYFEEAYKTFEDKILNRNAGLTTKGNILTVILNNNAGDKFDKLCKYIDIPELVRACATLDSARLVRQYQRKLEKHPNSKKYGSLIAIAQHLKQGVENMSLTSSKVKVVKRWVKGLSKSDLEYRAMMFPTDLWRRLADLTHLSPKKDFAVDWFLPFCYGEDAPEDTVAYAYKTLNYDNFGDRYSEHKFSYELIRVKLDMKNKYANADKLNTIRNMIVNNESVKTILWYWDELVTNTNVLDVLQRIKTSEDIDLSYGKIVDIISKTTNKEILDELIRLGEQKLGQYKMEVEHPVAVVGDASYSMEVAIKTSGIITSLLCYICNASLHLFHDKDVHFENPPRTIVDAVKFGKTVKVMGCTAPASSLWFYYKDKKVVKTFIIITDEYENRAYQNHRFADLYMKYMKEVYPAKLVFISFTDPNTDGQMAKDLKYRLRNQYDELVKVFKFNVKNPDLNRMDIVLKYLSGELN